MRPLIATIKLDNLRHNYELARAAHGDKTLAVLKANAYGHGAVRCAQALADIADGFAVACLEEAQQLRAAGIAKPILLLEGVFEAEELQLVDELDLWMAVASERQLAMVETAQPSKPFNIWLMMDSGMHREGFLPQDYQAAWRRLEASGKAGKITKMTHFARADEPDVPMTFSQLEMFDAATRGLPAGDESVANSAGILCHPRAQRNWGRVGIALYGVTPLSAGFEQDKALRPVMRFSSKVFGVRELGIGEPIGYGDNFITHRPTRVGLVACGYADGYPRLASSGSPALIDGKRSQLIGRVSMDMLTVDLTDLPEAGMGSEVELWGEAVSVNEVAANAGTIGYEPLCNVKRAHFVYV
ncbi:alanine racemase [Chromobacterium sp. IIBBL 290-4]|uniref:alanine racemase n=1 Tax=Chromobacterium sp. IIBBL 290-4 TaxID=2953890 RepID=UPI0020B78DD3|nr:alanine racemase [Chromobacterium sp. IIBBL 290-4]UTH74167.1 alanine racemase [Chromobacterium sp. IIBBL 290-4]